jgi:hypothetical protein
MPVRSPSAPFEDIIRCDPQTEQLSGESLRTLAEAFVVRYGALLPPLEGFFLLLNESKKTVARKVDQHVNEESNDVGNP